MKKNSVIFGTIFLLTCAAIIACVIYRNGRDESSRISSAAMPELADASATRGGQVDVKSQKAPKPVLASSGFEIVFPAGTVLAPASPGESPTDAQNFPYTDTGTESWGMTSTNDWVIRVFLSSSVRAENEKKAEQTARAECRVKIRSIVISGRSVLYCEQLSGGMDEGSAYVYVPESQAYIVFVAQNIETTRHALEIVKDGLTWK